MKLDAKAMVILYLKQVIILSCRLFLLKGFGFTSRVVDPPAGGSEQTHTAVTVRLHSSS